MFKHQLCQKVYAVIEKEQNMSIFQLHGSLKLSPAMNVFPTRTLFMCTHKVRVIILISN